MARSTRALAGAAKDAYLARVVASIEGLDEDARAGLIRRLTAEIALVSLRRQEAGNATPMRKPLAAHVTASPGGANAGASVMAIAAAEVPPAEAVAPAAAAAFDPYSPNVIVVIRTRGRDAVLEELHSIGDVECLRILAREQQLGIEAGLDDAAELRLAIVAAAERRIANRRAAAS